MAKKTSLRSNALFLPRMSRPPSVLIQLHPFTDESEVWDLLEGVKATEKVVRLVRPSKNHAYVVTRSDDDAVAVWRALTGCSIRGKPIGEILAGSAAEALKTAALSKPKPSSGGSLSVLVRNVDVDTKDFELEALFHSYGYTLHAIKRVAAGSGVCNVIVQLNDPTIVDAVVTEMHQTAKLRGKIISVEACAIPVAPVPGQSAAPAPRYETPVAAPARPPQIIQPAAPRPPSKGYAAVSAPSGSAGFASVVGASYVRPPAATAAVGSAARAVGSSAPQQRPAGSVIQAAAISGAGPGSATAVRGSAPSTQKVAPAATKTKPAVHALPKKSQSHDDDDDSKLCIVCLDEPREMMVLPCKCVCLGAWCAGTIDFKGVCPVCRKPMKGTAAVE
jgi:hypothetical protein